ncbi:hypothetical protein NHX12_017734 [Muraenolepis orangiensis]|uniref:Cysteine-rich protein 2-binding protein n=1 Tax=Muraenolepis orangiensis TaxID=630683 RepID=A0A9Q0IY04_9TELE|nr:hypothetical protein NHX12_017734 [Muraenolepis orangiensis]
MESSSDQMVGENEEVCTSASDGLEEGEVEGETVLMVESEDQVSVDLSHEQSGDSLTSDLEGEGGWACEDMAFYCDRCHMWIPSGQLRGEQPSYLKGDNFFKFICCSCSEDGMESFERMRLTWQQVVMLAMYNLSLEGTGRQGYFRWKEDICAFIGRHWTFLLGSRKKTITWWSTVAGCLSVGSPTFFRSGAQEFGEPGWWKLVQNRPPTLRPDLDKTTAKTKEKRSRTQEAKDIRRAQKEASYTDRSSSSTPVKLGGRGGRRPDLVLEKGEALFHDDEELEGEGMIDPGMESIPPPVVAMLTPAMGSAPHCRASSERWTVVCGPSERRRVHPEKKKGEGPGAPGSPHYAALCLYEERVLLRRLEACPLALAVTPQAARLCRKLAVRRAKRQRGLPLLDLDRSISFTLSLVGALYPPGPSLGRYCTGSQDLRVLDRFQSPLSSNRGLHHPSASFWHRLMGSDGGLDPAVRSPYTSRCLKPFIRRDYENRPLKMRLLAEIRAYPHRKDPAWSPGPEAPIDYCYVRPNHIPSVNAMCHDSFWPGVDLSECLQYPDFSVVALYKKVVIGFGFMVPDVKYNEAYISFLLVHPDWRRAGIATFMIYHLIQTCMGKDVTLHVSASNAAMLLYQKFGFQTEEYILDFYDKYYPADSPECRHAFYLRLRR